LLPELWEPRCAEALFLVRYRRRIEPHQIAGKLCLVLERIVQHLQVSRQRWDDAKAKTE